MGSWWYADTQRADRRRPGPAAVTTEVLIRARAEHTCMPSIATLDAHVNAKVRCASGNVYRASGGATERPDVTTQPYHPDRNNEYGHERANNSMCVCSRVPDHRLGAGDHAMAWEVLRSALDELLMCQGRWVNGFLRHQGILLRASRKAQVMTVTAVAAWTMSSGHRLGNSTHL